MMNWYELWASVRAPLESIHWLAPWVALSIVAYLVELAIDKWGVKWLAGRLPRTARLLERSIDGLWSTILAAAWAAGTTGEAEFAVYGALAGAVFPVLRRAREELARPAGPAVILLLALGASAPLQGCTPEEAKYASHVTSNQIAEALAWVDARTAADFERRSEAKIRELANSDGTVDDYDSWLESSGWNETRDRIVRAYEAHALIVSHLDGRKRPREDLRQALEDVEQAIRLGIAELESHGVQVPAYVEKSASYLPELEAIL